jgi:hypothetical protein
MRTLVYDLKCEGDHEEIIEQEEGYTFFVSNYYCTNHYGVLGREGRELHCPC